ncbi:Histone-lysine N-methyltransferase [Diplonema papillatum]|nr:Histone-lysine N-methyltransferase [Diplonema papillatum]
MTKGTATTKKAAAMTKTESKDRRGKAGVTKKPKYVPGKYALSTEDMAALKAKLYGQCTLKRKSMAWVKCPKFILDPLIDRFMNLANASSDDFFLDIGCGIGNVVQSVATRVGCPCVGIELVKSHYDVAMESAALFHKYREEHQLPQPSIEFIRSDARKVADDYVDTATIVWAANLLFPMEVNVFLINFMMRLRPGTRIFTMTNLIPHDPERNGDSSLTKLFEYEDLTWGKGEVEWTDVPGPLYMYTRTDVLSE